MTDHAQAVRDRRVLAGAADAQRRRHDVSDARRRPGSPPTTAQSIASPGSGTVPRRRRPCCSPRRRSPAASAELLACPRRTAAVVGPADSRADASGRGLRATRRTPCGCSATSRSSSVRCRWRRWSARSAPRFARANVSTRFALIWPSARESSRHCATQTAQGRVPGHARPRAAQSAGAAAHQPAAAQEERAVHSRRWRSVADVMERQVHHLVRLVDDLLEVSRITRG